MAIKHRPLLAGGMDGMQTSASELGPGAGPESLLSLAQFAMGVGPGPGMQWG